MALTLQPEKTDMSVTETLHYLLVHNMSSPSISDCIFPIVIIFETKPNYV